VLQQGADNGMDKRGGISCAARETEGARLALFLQIAAALPEGQMAPAVDGRIEGIA